MKYPWPILIFLVGIFIGGAVDSRSADPSLTDLLSQFQDYSGAELVFYRKDLPAGKYHDVLKPLDESRKNRAAVICIEEAKRFPQQYFAEVGLKKIGVFAACASKTTTDPSRQFDEQLGGYRYFGVYNGSDAIATSFYSEGQLALTFHHEIFHHVDSTVDGNTASWQLSSDDAFYQAAISQRKPYVAPPITAEDLAMLRKKCIGYTLKDAVSQYAAKNAREDQAETARHIMSMLPNSLVQAIEQPELAGSQRILHVMKEYERSVIDGPNFDWFVDVALGRATSGTKFKTAQELLDHLAELGDHVDDGVLSADPNLARVALSQVVRVDPQSISPEQSDRLVSVASKLTASIIRERIRPDQNHFRFDIWGQEDSAGVNHTLRHDVIQFGRDIERLRWIAAIHHHPSSSVTSPADTSLDNLRLLAKYYVFIDTHFELTSGTKQAFESARQLMVHPVSQDRVNLPAELLTLTFAEISQLNIKN
ncbi:MAG: hypothetical protein WBD20_05230 [Pirellulaceae bacterium]